MSAQHPHRPRPAPIQRAWLSELGLDRHFLEHLCRDDTFSDPAAAAVPKPHIANPADSIPQGASAVLGGQAIVGSTKAGLAHAQVVTPDSDRRVVNSDTLQAPSDSLPPLEPADTLHGLREQALACSRCALHTARATIVFGSGVDHQPAYMLVGEAPTTDDDRAGMPFQGRAGLLLQAMLQSAGINPNDSVYATQLVKCRPLGNRPPLEQEIQCCAAYLRRQIALVQPGCLVALGQLAAQMLTGQPQTLEQLRQAQLFYQCESGRRIPLSVTHNPTALLTRPQHKLQVWRDLMRLKGERVN